MGNPKGSNPSLDPLQKTLNSLRDIRAALLPFLQLLKDDDASVSDRNFKAKSATQKPSNKKRSRPAAGKDVDDGENEKSSTKPHRLTPHRRAEAEAAVALAVGTLRYMGARLRGQDRGRRKGDPLRAELDRIRGMLVSLRKLESGDGAAGSGAKGESSKKCGVDEKMSKGAKASVEATKKFDSDDGAKQGKGGRSIDRGGEKLSVTKKRRI